MNFFTRSIMKVFKGAVKSFETFPAAIGSALAFAIVTMIRIQLDWPEQEAYNFLFNCLHWSFALGAIFSLAAITAAQSRYNHAKAFKLANLSGILAVATAFFALYLFGGVDSSAAASRVATVSNLAAARVAAAILVSFLAFIVLAGYPKDQSDFSRAFFMTHKAFFIALLYGAVIMSGASSVAGAFQALLYKDMSSKVYMYIGTFAGFLAFAIFAGYFPDFRKGNADDHREVAQKQPRFVEILFEYIMVPIVLALTVVLLIWAGRTIVTGSWPVFVQLSSIATTYAFGGIWLHVMVTRQESGLAIFYRRVYPIAALIILAFEAWALVAQLGKSGLKMTEYYFILTWILAVSAAVLLLVRKARAHVAIVVLASALIVFSVLPAVGYQALPVAAQVGRLENLLVSEGILEDGQLIPATVEPDKTVRESITDAVDYLAYQEDAKLPDWFDKRLGEGAVFKEKLGFNKLFPEPEYPYAEGPGRYLGTSLMLSTQAVDISGYDWAVNLQESSRKGEASVSVEGNKGVYEIYWTINPPSGIPSLKITLDGNAILEQDMNAYIDRISQAFPPGQGNPSQASLEDMSVKLETQEASVLLVFNNIEINVDPRADTINYWLNLNAMYFKEKP